MPAWFLLPAAVSAIGAIGKYKGAAARTKAIEGLKPSKDSFKANTGYLKKYLSDLRGRSASRARTELAMRPALRAIGQQQGQAQRQLSYSAAQQGLAGSGIEAQKRLSLQQAGMQQAARVGETVGYSELNKARALQQQREGQEMKTTMQIGQMEGAAEQRFQEATRQWQGQLAGAKAAQTGAMWEGISDVAGSAVSGIGGHFQKIGQQKKFLDFLTSNPGIDPELFDKIGGGKVPGYQDGGVIDYFKESTGVQKVFDAETKRRQAESDQSFIDYEKALAAEKEAHKAAYITEARGLRNRNFTVRAEYNKLMKKIDDPEANFSKRKMRKLKKKSSALAEELKSTSLELQDRQKDPDKYIDKAGEEFKSKLTAPKEFTGLSQEDSTKILKKHLLEGMNAGVFTREGLISGYTKHRAKKEMSSFMGKVNSGTMTDADFWSDPYAMNNPQAAVKIYDSYKKKQAEIKTAEVEEKQDQAFGTGIDAFNIASQIPDDPNTAVNETEKALQATLSQLPGLGLSTPDYYKLSKSIQSQINSSKSGTSSDKKLAEKWGNVKIDVLAEMADLEPTFSTKLMELLNESGEGLSGENYQKFENLMITEIQALATSDENYFNEFLEKMESGLTLQDAMEGMQTTIKGTEARRKINQLKSVLKKINNPEFRIEDEVEVQDEVDSGEPIMVNSAEEYAKLPSGTQYTAPDGSIKIKR